MGELRRGKIAALRIPCGMFWTIAAKTVSLFDFMRILLSNDDGIHAEGLQALTEALSEVAEVVVSAPDRERSGNGHALTLHRPLRILQRGPDRFAVDGTPTDSVMLGLLEACKGRPVDLVVSGINHGPNVGHDITYSGTVSAALEGALMGIPSIAVSLAMRGDEKPNFKPAQAFLRRIVPRVIERRLPPDTLLNINVPNLAGDGAGLEYEVTRLGNRKFTGSTVEKLDPRGRKYYWIGGVENDFIPDPGTDSTVVAAGKVSITPIRVDFTHQSFIAELRQWKL